MDRKVTLVVSSREAGTRLDAFIARRCGLSRSRAARLAEDGVVLVDGCLKKPSFRLHAGMEVIGTWHDGREAEQIPGSAIPLEIVFEDPWIVVVNKPAGMTVHPGAGTAGDTLANALLARYPEVAFVGEPGRPGIVHRLDKLTSGVMVVARTPQAHAVLSAAFKAHEHTREYVAVCWGRMPEERGTIDTLMARNPRDRKRMTSRAGQGRKAVTNWEVIREWRNFSLLRLRLGTGRTHQIRVHLSEMGHPVAGDPVYGGRRRANTLADTQLRACVRGLDRQLLHATLLGIRHPESGRYMEFTCDTPDDIETFMAVLDERDSLHA